MRIVDVEAFPISVKIPPERSNTVGIGRMVKRDAVIVKVTTEDGIIGYGESHHARNPGSVANLINTTMRDLVKGMDATDTTGVWSKVYRAQIGSHGMGAGSVIALSGIDMALWDARGKAVGWPIYKLLGGSARAVPAYAGGGGSLGFNTPEATVEEVRGFVGMGYRALKIRLGQGRKQDVARLEAVRKAFPDLVVLTDANTAYSLDDARYVMPALEALDITWLEEPFPQHDMRSYQIASGFSRTPLALGENTYTRFEFVPHIEAGHVQILQPDVGKCGGVTEIMRIAAHASAYKIQIHPHGGVTGLDLMAGIHILSAIENGGYFESSEGYNPLRNGPIVGDAYTIGADGCVRASDKPGLGLEVDEAFIKAHPVLEGPGFV
ncbi:MAG TPA: mandelate racemase/muconate lactonizing enzyme family protein [Dongiaceae bacterium]|nr:mandelate racemase/muconate lactonizing enzyme family protein [Dongiaceae bacterium]